MKKLLAIIMATALIATAFAGCGSENNTSEKADTEKAVSKGTLVMGTNPAFPPYEFTDSNGKIVGIDAEIAQAIAEDMGYTLEIKDMEFDSLIAAVSSGSIDMVLAGMTVTEERKQSVNFSDSYAKGVQSIIVPENSKIKGPDDLKGKKIAVQAGTTGDIYCTDDFGQKNISQYPNGAQATAALVNGQVDAVVIDNEPAKQFVAQNEGLKILETAYAEEDYAIAIAKDNTELLENVNKTIKSLKESGKLAEIVGKYIKA